VTPCVPGSVRPDRGVSGAERSYLDAGCPEACVLASIAMKFDPEPAWLPPDRHVSRGS